MLSKSLSLLPCSKCELDVTGIGQIKNKTESSPKNESNRGAGSDSGMLGLLSEMNMGTPATRLTSLETETGAKGPPSPCLSPKDTHSITAVGRIILGSNLCAPLLEEMKRHAHL